MNDTTSIIIILACVLMSAFFSATETAFSTMNKTRLKTLVEKDNNKRAKLAISLSDQYDKLISTILIGNNIVNILLASIATVLFVRILGGDHGATVSTVVCTIVVLIFGEITPKSVAKDVPERFAMMAAPIMRALMVVLTPINFLFSAWKKLISKLLRVQEDTKMSQEELLMLVEEVQQEGTIDIDEGELLKNAIEFNDLKAEDILTHRVDLEGVDIDASKAEIAAVFNETRFSRLPVFQDTIDNIVGIIHQKDFYVGESVYPGDVKDIISPPLFIHKSEMISDLLKQLQREKSHIAIVVDEYGGTLGIVTMEDILEELVGEIWDEHDEVVEDYLNIGDNSFIVDCAVNPDDFFDRFAIKGETDSVSLGGWIMEQMGCIPEVGDGFQYDNLEIVVTEAEAHRLSKVKVVINEKEKEEQATKDGK